MKTCVVKLGGSLSFSTALPLWLKALSNTQKTQRLIIVPGGGPYADKVRETQTQMDFSDSAAHHMALLAMAQWGLVLHDKLADAQLFYLDKPLAAIPGLNIWIPDRTVLDYPELTHSWRITSDSLSCWLAHQLAADELHIIKSAPIHSSDTQQLIEAEILDEAFAAFTSDRLPVQLFDQHQSQTYPDTGVYLK